MNIKLFFTFLISAFIIGCGSSDSSNNMIKDLAFQKAQTSKEYSDLILKAVRTSRGKVVFDQLNDKAEIDFKRLNYIVNAYSQSVGNSKWEYEDYYAEHEGEPGKGKGYDYTWYDKRGRIAIQVNILPTGTSKQFKLDKIEFRSRIDILESEAFPGGEIDDYKKLASKK